MVHSNDGRKNVWRTQTNTFVVCSELDRISVNPNDAIGLTVSVESSIDGFSNEIPETFAVNDLSLWTKDDCSASLRNPLNVLRPLDAAGASNAFSAALSSSASVFASAVSFSCF